MTRRWCTAVLVFTCCAGVLCVDRAQASTMKVEKTREAAVIFAGAGCGATDQHTLTAPAGGYRVRSEGLEVDDHLEAAQDYEDVATVSSIAARRVGGRATLTWTVVGSGAACGRRPDGCDDFDEFDEFDEQECEPALGSWPWETEEISLRMSYLVRRRVPMFTLREMRSDARAALATEFDAAYEHGYGRRLSCRRISRYVGSCRFSWVIGDGFYQGSFVSTKTVRRRGRYQADQIRIRNRGSATLTDEYCQVTGGSNCITRHPIRF